MVKVMTRTGWALAVLSFTAGIGCGGEPDAQENRAEGPRGMAASPPSMAALAGDWEGETSQAQAIRFTLSGAGLTSVDLNWDLPGCWWATTISFVEPLAVADGALSARIALDSNGSAADLAITFSSPRVAEGTATFSTERVADAPAECAGRGQVTFNASKL